MLGDCLRGGVPGLHTPSLLAADAKLIGKSINPNSCLAHNPVATTSPRPKYSCFGDQSLFVPVGSLEPFLGAPSPGRVFRSSPGSSCRLSLVPLLTLRSVLGPRSGPPWWPVLTLTGSRASCTLTSMSCDVGLGSEGTAARKRTRRRWCPRSSLPWPDTLSDGHTPGNPDTALHTTIFPWLPLPSGGQTLLPEVPVGNQIRWFWLCGEGRFLRAPPEAPRRPTQQAAVRPVAPSRVSPDRSGSAGGR